MSFISMLSPLLSLAEEPVGVVETAIDNVTMIIPHNPDGADLDRCDAIDVVLSMLTTVRS